MATYLALYISTRNYNYTYITKVYGALKSHQQRCRIDLLEFKKDGLIFAFAELGRLKDGKLLSSK